MAKEAKKKKAWFSLSNHKVFKKYGARWDDATTNSGVLKSTSLNSSNRPAVKGCAIDRFSEDWAQFLAGLFYGQDVLGKNFLRCGGGH